MSSQGPGGKALPFLQGHDEHKYPVCGMTVVPEKAAVKAEHDGKTYYFCSKGCAKRFSDDPEKFLAAPGTGKIKHSPAPAEHGVVQHTGAAALRAASDATKVRYTSP